MNDNATVTDAEVIQNPIVEPVVNPAIEKLLEQQTSFKSQLEQIKKDMAKLQADFQDKKIQGVRLEGAIEAGEILLKSLQK